MQALNSNYQLPTKQGWPKLVFAVYERDGWAQTDAFAAYGVCNLPLTPGLHDVEAHCWRANNRNARMREEIAALFAGARAELDGWKQCVIRREELYSSPAVTVGTVKGKARVAHLLAGGFRDDGGDGGDPRAALAVIAALLLLASLRHGATGSDDWACQKRILRDARTDASFHPASRSMSADTLRQHRHARQIWPGASSRPRS